MSDLSHDAAEDGFHEIQLSGKQIVFLAMVLTVASGLGLWLGYGFAGGWLHVKAGLVALLVAYHFWLRSMLGTFARDANTRTHVFYRWVNELPTVLLVAIVVLVVVKPF